MPTDEQLREREKGLRLNTNELFFLREGYEEGYEAAWIQRDAEVQALKEALEQAKARLRVLAGDIHSVWLRDIDVALTGGRQALPTTADVIGILREEGTDDE